MSEFAQPGPPSGDPFPMDTHVGRLLMFEVTEHVEHVPTVHTQPGEKTPAVRANITVIDGQSPGEHFRESLVFNKVLIGQLRSNVGRLVLGRLTLGAAKPGKNAPYELTPANQSDTQQAQAWLAAHRQPTVTSAEPPF